MKFDVTNTNRKNINVDIDGTLTNGELFWETEPTPNPDMVNFVREMYSRGNIIIIHTARQWSHTALGIYVLITW